MGRAGHALRRERRQTLGAGSVRRQPAQERSVRYLRDGRELPFLKSFDGGAPLPWLRVGIVSLGIAGVFGALGFTETWKRVELKGFDFLSVAAAPGRSQL